MYTCKHVRLHQRRRRVFVFALLLQCAHAGRPDILARVHAFNCTGCGAWRPRCFSVCAWWVVVLPDLAVKRSLACLSWVCSGRGLSAGLRSGVRCCRSSLCFADQKGGGDWRVKNAAKQAQLPSAIHVLGRTCVVPWGWLQTGCIFIRTQRMRSRRTSATCGFKLAPLGTRLAPPKMTSKTLRFGTGTHQEPGGWAQPAQCRAAGTFAERRNVSGLGALLQKSSPRRINLVVRVPLARILGMQLGPLCCASWHGRSLVWKGTPGLEPGTH